MPGDKDKERDRTERERRGREEREQEILSPPERPNGPLLPLTHEQLEKLKKKA